MRKKEEPLSKFTRLEKIIGTQNVDILSQKTVLVLGCGGVGGYVCEALARSNIGTLILVDYDKVDETNINRQIIALNSTIGRGKVDVLEERIKDINENCNVIKIAEFIDSNNLEILWKEKIDFLVDACDTINTKPDLSSNIAKYHQMLLNHRKIGVFDGRNAEKCVTALF